MRANKVKPTEPCTRPVTLNVTSCQAGRDAGTFVTPRKISLNVVKTIVEVSDSELRE